MDEFQTQQIARDIFGKDAQNIRIRVVVQKPEVIISGSERQVRIKMATKPFPIPTSEPIVHSACPVCEENRYPIKGNEYNYKCTRCWAKWYKRKEEADEEMTAVEAVLDLAEKFGPGVGEELPDDFVPPKVADYYTIFG